MAFLALVMVAACAKEPRKRVPPRPEEKPSPVQPTPPTPEEFLSPRREASQKIVEIGKRYLEKQEFDKANQTFQEAINVDPDNGIAYYFLAKGLYFTKNYEEALGLLDRAESLLVAYPEWMEEIFKLKFFIQEARRTSQEEIEKQKEQYY